MFAFRLPFASFFSIQKSNGTRLGQGDSMNMNFSPHVLVALSCFVVSLNAYSHGEYVGDNIVNLDPAVCRPAGANTQFENYTRGSGEFNIGDTPFFITVHCPLPMRGLRGYEGQSGTMSLRNVDNISMDVQTLAGGSVSMDCKPFSYVLNETKQGTQQSVFNADGKTTLSWDAPFSDILDHPLVRNFGIECFMPGLSTIYNIEMVVSEEDHQ